MAYVADPSAPLWTAVDLVRQLGPMPLHRVVSDPAPGSATVDDVVRMETDHDRLCELIDGTLVEKTMGAFESFLAGTLIQLLNNYLATHRIGIALTTDGMMQLFPNQVRIPDACFISWERLEGSGFPDKPLPDMVPEVAAEIISRGNTQEEMDRKLRDYFTAGVRMVWYFYPVTKTVKVFTSPESSTTLNEGDTLDGGEVLPGFTLALDTFFRPPRP